jgi:predicted tellurium resistance membrane protein TerC
MQITLFDIAFSMDAVITRLVWYGTSLLWLIAIVGSVLIMLFAVKPIGILMMTIHGRNGQNQTATQ